MVFQLIPWMQALFGLALFGLVSLPSSVSGTASPAPSPSSSTFLLVPRDSSVQTKGDCTAPFGLGDHLLIREAIATERNRTTRAALRRQSDSDILIDVHFNVLLANLTYEGGLVPRSQIDAQMRVLNQGFSGSGIQFQHTTTSYVLQPTWFHEFNVPDTEEVSLMLHAFGAAFRQGGASTLNINLIGLTHDENTYGFAFPPTFYQRYPKYDGVFAKFISLPGGASPYRQGSTVIHEAGHWLGLWHTFQNGCTDGGDGIDDTPPSGEESTGCPIGKDTCPGDGVDPIHNFMDYSEEGCRNEFTPGQIERMHDVMRLYRSGS